MRNILVHDYFGIDLDVVWTVIERDLRQLKPQIMAILYDLGDDARGYFCSGVDFSSNFLVYSSP